MKFAPSTSRAAGMAAYASSESMWAGRGHMSWMPSTCGRIEMERERE
jgi:hypothetical protein